MTRFLLDLRMAWRNVFRNRRRSACALGTIAMGALGLLLFMGFNRGLMNQYRANTIRARWGHGQLFVQGYRGQAHARPWEKWIADPARVEATLRGLPAVVGVFPRLTLQAVLVAGEQAVAAQGEGVDGPAEAGFFDQLNYVEGADFGSHADGIDLGQGLARGLGVRVGDLIQVMVQGRGSTPQTAAATVTGVFHTGSHEFDTRAFRLPLALAQSLLETDRVESIAVALTGVEAWPAFARAAAAALPSLEPIPFDELDRVYYRHAVDWLDAQFAFIRGIILLVVFLGIVNIISITVLERTGEIGALRANGESRTEIAFGQTLEALILGLLGGALGLLAGWLVAAGPLREGVAMPPAPGITRSFRILIELGRRDALNVLLLCGLTAVTGCLVPVWRAIRISVVEALRHA